MYLPLYKIIATGSITQLQFPSRSHLLSASEDGTLCLFRARDWVVLRALKGHKGRVNSIAVHPSNKVALSVGKDNTLRMWDLMRGKGSASTKLGKGKYRLSKPQICLLHHVMV
jgi:protein MAK11